MGGGTGNGGSLAGEQLRIKREATTDSTPRKERIARIAKKSALLATPVLLAASAAVAVDAWTDKNDKIFSLEETVDNKTEMLDAAISLGNAGVRFADVKIFEDDIIVEIPGTTTSCQTINFNYSNTAEGWTLSLDQSDAAGQVYDTAEAHNAASVTALVDDLCS